MKTSTFLAALTLTLILPVKSGHAVIGLTSGSTAATIAGGVIGSFGLGGELVTCSLINQKHGSAKDFAICMTPILGEIQGVLGVIWPGLDDPMFTSASFLRVVSGVIAIGGVITLNDVTSNGQPFGLNRISKEVADIKGIHEDVRLEYNDQIELYQAVLFDLQADHVNLLSPEFETRFVDAVGIQSATTLVRVLQSFRFEAN